MTGALQEGLELIVVDEFIYTTLHNDATLTALMAAAGSVIDEIYNDTIPSAVQYPYIIFHQQANRDTWTNDGILVLNTSLYTVKVVDRAESYSAIKPIYAQVHALLHRKKFVNVTDGQMMFCRKETSIHFPEITEAVAYRHLGGTYRFWV